jgi:hypothetical protein
MSEVAITQTTEALKNLIEQAIGPGKVHIGAPMKDERKSKEVSLFLFHIEPNAELRNERRFEAPAAIEPAQRPVMLLDALPLDLRYLITVFRGGDISTADPTELTTLGQIIQVLHAQSTLSGSELPNQVVRLTPEPYPMEEMSRIWGLFPNETYRTSMVYLATPVFVEAGNIGAGPPVLRRKQKSGIISAASDDQDQTGGGV